VGGRGPEKPRESSSTIFKKQKSGSTIKSASSKLYARIAEKQSRMQRDAEAAKKETQNSNLHDLLSSKQKKK